ncbi:MAG: DUF3768 domain-containing protein [Bacteriovoracaceae bacterium]|nr:DUF3768 domain-containing protein [Bacteriovoracaceae bacterium]
MNKQIITNAELATQNDIFRSTFKQSPSDRIVFTSSVTHSDNLEEIKNAVKNFKTFEEGDDPYGEHDFGTFDLKNTKYYWKIDYYDTKFEFGADPHCQPFNRVLTIMEASDY